jgi:hypothetical protein
MTKKEEESFIEKEINKIVKDKFSEDEVKKITVNTLTNLFKVLWNRKGVWSNAV